MLVQESPRRSAWPAVVQSLLGRVPPASIVASVRDPTKAAALAQQGVKVCAGNFADAESLKAAFRGADQVLIVSADKLGEEALRLHRTAIETARDTGTRPHPLHQPHGRTCRVALPPR